MQMPPLVVSRRNTSSGTLRSTSHSARADEWLNITGSVLVSSAWCITSVATCERSTIMPMRFISRTTVRPKSFIPPSTRSSVAESAHDVLWL